MKLVELVPRIGDFPRDGIICVKRPWQAASECVVAKPTADLGVPDEVKEKGFEYFIEIHVALEVLEALGDKHGRELDLLLHYAENDGFPEWLYA